MTSSERLAGARDLFDAAVAANARGRPAAAARSFRAALRLLDATTREPPSADVTYLRVRSIAGLAVSEYELSGHLGPALDQLTHAEELAVSVGIESLTLVIRGQRGLLRLRAGAIDDALAELAGAAEFIAGARPFDAAVLLLNRGTLQLERGRLEKAAADFEGCIEHAELAGDPLLASKARHNLGYLHFLRGDLPASLGTMDEAAVGDETGVPAAVGLLDRAQVLYEAGLLTDADVVLRRAAALLAADHVTRDLAEVEVVRSRCLQGLGQHREAIALARSARRRFARMGNEPWTLRSELAVIDAQIAEARLPARPPKAALQRLAVRAEAVAEQAGKLGGAVGASIVVAAHLLAGEAWFLSGRLDRAERLLGAMRWRPGRSPLPQRVRRDVLLAQLAFAGGDRPGGLRAVRHGQRQLAAHRAQFGSVEAVTASAVHGVRLGQVDVAAALGTGDPYAVFDAVARGRATFAGISRVRPPDDPETAGLLAQARQALERARLISLDADESAIAERDALRRQARRLQDQVRQRAWRRSGDAVEVARPVTGRGLRRALDVAGERETVVVDFFALAGQLHAVRLSASGLRLVRVAPMADVEEQVRRVRADLEILSNPLVPGTLRAVAGSSLDRSLCWLDRTLLGPMSAPGALQVGACDILLAVPWASLPSRAGLMTTVNSQIARADFEPFVTPRVAVVAGPGLAQAEAEAAAVADVWRATSWLSGTGATCAATSGLLARSEVVHLAAHGRHEPDNPLFSSVRLADGPLFAHELDGVALPGSVIVLSSCEVGIATARPGGEVLGLTSVLLRLGARAVIASVAPLRDDVAAEVMPTLHSTLRRTGDPAAALAAAVAAVDEPVPLVCFGPMVVRGGGWFGAHRSMT